MRRPGPGRRTLLNGITFTSFEWAHFHSKGFYEVSIMIGPSDLHFEHWILYTRYTILFFSVHILRCHVLSSSSEFWSLLKHISDIGYYVICIHICTIYKQESQIRDAALFMLNVKLYSVTRINWFCSISLYVASSLSRVRSEKNVATRVVRNSCKIGGGPIPAYYWWIWKFQWHECCHFLPHQI